MLEIMLMRNLKKSTEEFKEKLEDTNTEYRSCMLTLIRDLTLGNYM